jgi:hypothetical protein
MLAEVAATSLNESIFWAVVLSHRQDFVWILVISLGLTVAALPLIVRGERSRSSTLHAAPSGGAAPR